MPHLLLKPVNANVHSVHLPDGTHVGNLKRIGDGWKFKAIGYDTGGSVVPGDGPFTAWHNTAFAQADVDALCIRLGD